MFPDPPAEIDHGLSLGREVLLAFLCVLWWFFTYGLIELLIEGWGRTARFMMLVSLGLTLAFFLYLYPHQMFKRI